MNKPLDMSRETSQEILENVDMRRYHVMAGYCRFCRADDVYRKLIADDSDFPMVTVDVECGNCSQSQS
ncbi:MAG: hypothetical protein P8175_05620 [Deltaproteobacteria bacterium]|jgi:hypothetical protein